MNKDLLRKLSPLFLLYVFINAPILSFQSQLAKNGIDQSVLIFGNLIIFLAALISMLVSIRGIRSVNPQSAVRSMYLSFMVKFFVIAIAGFTYIMVVKKEVNKPALLACAGLYILYTVIEVRVLTRMLNKKKNA